MTNILLKKIPILCLLLILPNCGTDPNKENNTDKNNENETNDGLNDDDHNLTLFAASKESMPKCKNGNNEQLVFVKSENQFYRCESGEWTATPITTPQITIELQKELSGTNCEFGGTKISSGNDADEDGVLTEHEVKEISYACNGTSGESGTDGADGTNSLIDIVDEAAGNNCTSGGKKLKIGLDNGKNSSTPNNSILEDGEVLYSKYICNGSNGADGSTGTTGETGNTGAQGPSGADGYISLFALNSEPSGANCTAGGIKIHVGIDNGDGGGTQRNQTLEAGEVDVTTYVCNGTQGSSGTNGFSTLLSITEESAGNNCVVGGKRLDSGLDNGDGSGTANNGTLESGEIDNTAYQCRISSFPRMLFTQGTVAYNASAATKDALCSSEFGSEYVTATSWDSVTSLAGVYSSTSNTSNSYGFAKFNLIDSDKTFWLYNLTSDYYSVSLSGYSTGSTTGLGCIYKFAGLRFTRSTIAANASDSDKLNLCTSEVGSNYTPAKYLDVVTWMNGKIGYATTAFVVKDDTYSKKTEFANQYGRFTISNVTANGAGLLACRMNFI